ncbi:MAG: hypothetical protein ABWY53_11755, partial [Leifsonia flava]
SLYVFDKRGSIDFSDHAAVIGHCVVDGTATKRMQNCTDLSCREQLVVCEGCAAAAPVYCVAHAAAAAPSR